MIRALKLDASGAEQWSTIIGGTADLDCGEGVVALSGGGYLIAGYTQSFGAGALDVYVAEVNASGTVQWTTTFGDYHNDYAMSVLPTADGCYLLVGTSHSYGTSDDVYVVKMDADGNGSSAPTS